MTMGVTDSNGSSMHVYGYDKTYQVTEVNYPVGYEYLATDTTFNYDGVGNRTTVIDTGGTTSYTTNALNQYTSVGGAAYVYDDNGNMTYDGKREGSHLELGIIRLTTRARRGSSGYPGLGLILSFKPGGCAIRTLRGLRRSSSRELLGPTA